ncbi:maleylpyruvate isomerase N-terminal domain-containing protein [Streptomyces sp. S6]
MYTPLSFPELLRLIDEQSATFRSVVESAPSLDAPVPSCPGWTLADLAQHIGQGRRKWARIVAAGPADGPVQVSDVLPEEREAVSTWLAEGTRLLLDSLRTAGPGPAGRGGAIPSPPRPREPWPVTSSRNWRSTRTTLSSPWARRSP